MTKTDTSSPRFDLGGVSISIVSGGRLKLDGGAMFGIIPKPLWSRRIGVDDQNRIQLACNCVLIEWDGPGARKTLIETGHGAKFAQKEQEIFAIDSANWLLPSLVARGIDAAQIDDVILSHLHFDHAGGLTHYIGDELTRTFPKAAVHAQRREFDDARRNFGIMKITYREENYTPIDNADAWRLHDGEGELVPGVSAARTAGHTHGHQSLIIRGRDRAAVFLGDVMPTRHHLGAPYNMGYDLLPIDNRDSKSRMLRQAAEQDALIIIDHEPDHPVCRVARDGDWYSLQPAE
ncbi:MAG: MBL fold metallo-hydrolase [Phycisphaerales bacterium]|nr:MBL fold metallo-hydrolase [Phycisphaerales bacterium]